MTIVSGLVIICQPSLNFYVVLLRLLLIMSSPAIAISPIVKRATSNAI